MQTPHFPRSLFVDDFQRVYEPSEDSFLLLDALEQDLDSIRRDAWICLECGSGSGVIITALAQALAAENVLDGRRRPNIGRLLLATDLNWDACKTTKKCASYNNHGGDIEIIRTDLAQALVDRLQNSVDLLIFNPPYVPTDESETCLDWLPGEGSDSGRSSGERNRIHMSWAGGERGRKLIDRFLNNYVPRLLSKPNGVAYMVGIYENNLTELQDYLIQNSIHGDVVLRRRAGIEDLYVIKYRWAS